jgi:hypothetical protein
VTARLAGQSPWQLLQSRPLELDFNNAVASYLYRFEQAREVERLKALARLIGVEVAREVGRLFLPVWGYQLKESGATDGQGPPAPGQCEHEEWKKLPSGELQCLNPACGAVGN